ncbi:MAG TPA: ThuA domain-containing protein [Planctomycetota bacterium]|nr:ThuA domain-containing protein [Planctomycetota bacterium]
MSHWAVRLCVGVLALGFGLALAATPAEELKPFVGEEALAKIAAAAPEKAAVKPEKPRRVLVFTESAKDLETAQKNQGMKFVPHPSAAHCALAIETLGKKAGAFEATIANDPKVFDTPDGLKVFDAIVLANIYLERKLYRTPRDLNPNEKPAYEARQKALLDFVNGGKGLVGIHNAACTALAWPEFNAMIGGTHAGHAWWSHQAVPVKLDDPQHPLNAAFGGQGFTASDDIYAFTAPYSREALHVLLSIEADKAPQSMTAERPDGDYPISWVRAAGSGRVFYTALGHEPATFQDAKFLRHVLDGIQFALGDLKADASPGKPLPAKPDFTTMAGWTPLFDGKDLGAWDAKGNQAEHWLVEDGIIRYDGKSGTLRTKQAFTDYVLRVDWRLPRQADSGVFVRDSSQLNIWTWAMGSGEMWEHRGGWKPKAEGERNPYIPLSREDRAVGEWNTFVVTVKDNKVTVLLNGKEVIREAALKTQPHASTLGLQQHGDPIEYKSIYVKDLAEAK